MMNKNSNKLKLKRLGIDTQKEFVVYMRADCHICISEGFEAMTRLEVRVKEKTIIATLNVLRSELLGHDEGSLSESAWKSLDANEGDEITFSHLQPVDSMSDVRAKMYGRRLDKSAFRRIIKDIAAIKYSNIELAAFITACAGDHLNTEEITGLTLAMVEVGEKLKWEKEIVVDKHCVGGLPGNRTTPIVVSIIAAAGLTIPKTSSRAITSPAGTADTMETMTNVNLSINKIRKVVQKEGGCIVWGGAVALSPADDVLIKIEKALDIDSEGQMIASVLSKKAAAGSTHVVIDIPVGKTAKVRTNADAQKLNYYFTVVGQAIGLNVNVLITDGSQPVGKGIGPALEALDVLAVLKNDKNAPLDLKERATLIAGTILELSRKSSAGNGQKDALQILHSKKAFKKFVSICKEQGGFHEPVIGNLQQKIYADQSGIVAEIDNRRLAKVAKLSGAPNNPGAGVLFLAPLGKKVSKGDLLFTLYAESNGELAYALEYLKSQSDIIKIEQI
jgi:thymidine phosphorylase